MSYAKNKLLARLERERPKDGPWDDETRSLWINNSLRKKGVTYAEGILEQQLPDAPPGASETPEVVDE